MSITIRLKLLFCSELERVRYICRASSNIVTYSTVVLYVVLCVTVSLLLLLALLSMGRVRLSGGGGPGGSTLSYAVVVDAGSSGSRGHLFMWPPHSGSVHELLSVQPMRDPATGRPLVKSVTPGLSSLAHDPQSAVSYLSPLLDFATEHIPAGELVRTPLYVLATAGMRLLNDTDRDAIISALYDGLQRNYSFILAPSSIQVITGREEGIYQWIAANFALNRFDHGVMTGGGGGADVTRVETVSGGHIWRPATVAVVDMGGASMQIAFEVTTRGQHQSLMNHSGVINRISLGCSEHTDEHSYRLYVRTFLGYGANEMLKRHQQQLVASITDASKPVYDPCLVLDYRQQIALPVSICQSSSSTTAAAAVVDVGGGAPSMAVNTSAVPPPPVRHTATASVPVVAPARRRRRMSSDPAERGCRASVVGSGDWQRCETALVQQLRTERSTRACNSSARAEVAECGSHVLAQLPSAALPPKLLGFSEFWYSSHDLLGAGGPYRYSSFRQRASRYCSTRWRLLSRNLSRSPPGGSTGGDRVRWARQCFKAVYLTVALHEGLGVSRHSPGVSTSPGTIGSRVASWPIGALLYKLRFLPLSAADSLLSPRRPSAGAPGAARLPLMTGSATSYLLPACIVVVAAFLAVFANRLRRMRRGRGRSLVSAAFGTADVTPLLPVRSFC